MKNKNDVLIVADGEIVHQDSSIPNINTRALLQESDIVPMLEVEALANNSFSPDFVSHSIHSLTYKPDENLLIGVRDLVMKDKGGKERFVSVGYQTTLDPDFLNMCIEIGYLISYKHPVKTVNFTPTNIQL